MHTLRDNSLSKTRKKFIDILNWQRKIKIGNDYNQTKRINHFEYLKIPIIVKQISRKTIKFNDEEFDPGSGWTLAAGLTHASRGVT